MAGKFELYTDKGGKFRFRLKASNGQTILASQGYKTKAAAKNGIAAVQRNCGDDKCFVEKPAANGKCMFNLRSRNNQVIGTSEIYNTEAACKNGIASVKKSAPGAKIDEV